MTDGLAVDLAQRVHELVGSVIGIPVDDQDPSIAYHQRPEWGSLEQVRIMARLHEEFGIGRRPSDLETLITPARIVDAVQASRSSSADGTGMVPSASPLDGRLDRGLATTYLDETRITDIDAGRARFFYRGYDVPTLARTMTYESVAHLLIEGELAEPDPRRRGLMLEGAYLARSVGPWRGTYADFVSCFASLPSVTSAEATPEELRTQGWRLLGAAAQILSRQTGVTVLADHRLPDCVVADVVDLRGDERAGVNQLMILQADHGSSAAALAVRAAVSAGAGLHPALVAGLAVFGGHRHGGAMEAVTELVEALSDPGALRAWARDAVQRGFPVPGFGHRVYRQTDPRVEPIRTLFHAAERVRGDCWWSTQLEQLRDEMHPLEEVGAAANVDLYSGPLLRLYGCRAGSLTAAFALARIGGWVAHAVEQAQARTLIRPRLKYVGPRITEADR